MRYTIYTIEASGYVGRAFTTVCMASGCLCTVDCLVRVLIYACVVTFYVRVRLAVCGLPWYVS